MANTFDGLEVVLEGEDKDAESKPLFYLPKTSEEALDPERIRKSEFHFGLWEIPYAGQSISFRETRQPGAVEDVKFLEASIAALVYHPRYGAGERKERDRLVVKDRDGKDVLFSGAWLADRIFVRDESHHSNALNSTPVDALMRHAPRLFRRDALRLSDFRITGEGTYEPERSRVTTSGEVSINNVKYYLGRGFHKTPIRVERVAPGLGAVVELDQENNLTGKVVATFTTYEAGDPVLTRQETGTGTAWRAGAKEVGLRDYSQESFNHLSDGEHVDDLRERIEAMDRFQKVLNFDNALKRQNRTRLRELPRKEINWIRNSPDMTAGYREDILKLTQDYARDGLELVALVADIPKVIPEVKRVLGKMTPEARRVFLDGFKGIARARREAIEALDQAVVEGRMEEKEAHRIRFELGSQMGELVEIADALKHTQDAIGSKEILLHLREKSDSSVIFTQLFRDAFKGVAGVELEKIKGLEFDSVSAGELSEVDQKDMLDIAWKNWSTQAPEITTDLLKSMEKAMAFTSQSRWYVLRKDKKIRAFMRVDDYHNGTKEVASLNVDLDWRDSAVGEAVFARVVAREAMDGVVTAHFLPQVRAGSMYVERYGFNIVGEETTRLGDRILKQFRIERSDDKNQSARSRSERVHQKDVIRWAETGGEPSGMIVQRVDLTHGNQVLADAIKSITDRPQWEVTRYIIDPKNSNIRYVVGESLPEAKSELVGTV